jgi:hypothetical protein
MVKLKYRNYMFVSNWREDNMLFVYKAIFADFLYIIAFDRTSMCKLIRKKLPAAILVRYK